MIYIPDELYNRIKEVMPIPCVDIVVTCDKDILLLRRQIPPLKGYWCFPGGRIEKGEEPQEAAARELKEETGIITDRFIEMGVFCYFHKDRQDITITYHTKVISKIVTLNPEHNAYTWVTKEKLPWPIHDETLRQVKKVR